MKKYVKKARVGAAVLLALGLLSSGDAIYQIPGVQAHKIEQKSVQQDVTPSITQVHKHQLQKGNGQLKPLQKSSNQHQGPPEQQSLIQLNSKVNQKQQSSNKIAMKGKQKQMNQNKSKNGGENPDAGSTDSISTSNTDDMFAFSQIIAGGDKVSQVTAMLDKEAKSQDTKVDDEDMAVLAFSNTLPGNADEPVPQVIDVQKVEEEQKAMKELDELQKNDATAAFGALVQAEVIQQKVIDQTEKTGEDSADQIEQNFQKLQNSGEAPSESAVVTQPGSAKQVKGKKLAQKKKLVVKKKAVKKDTKAEKQDDTPPVDPATLMDFSNDVAQAASKKPADVTNLQIDAEDINLGDLTVQKKQKSSQKPVIAAQLDQGSQALSLLQQLSKLNVSPEQLQQLTAGQQQPQVQTQPAMVQQQQQPVAQPGAQPPNSQLQQIQEQIRLLQQQQSQIQNQQKGQAAIVITDASLQQTNQTQAGPPPQKTLVAQENQQDPIQVAQEQAQAIIDQGDQSQDAGDKKEQQAEGEKGGKNGKPIDKLEKDEQPADNDDDEKVADNHRKMAKIELKRDEIRKLEDTHQALTKDALKQAKSGASMKKVQHNLKIAKSVAKRVQDLKQQVQSDQKQLQPIKDADDVHQNLPFKNDSPTIQHSEVSHIPSIQDSSTGNRHAPNILGSLLGVKSENMDTQKLMKKTHSKKYLKDIESARNQIKTAESGMKKMDQEVKDFHNHMQKSMATLMAAFNEGFGALEKAKKDEKEQEAMDKKETQTQVQAQVDTQAPIDAQKTQVVVNDPAQAAVQNSDDQKLVDNQQAPDQKMVKKDKDQLSSTPNVLAQTTSDSFQQTLADLQNQIKNQKNGEVPVQLAQTLSTLIQQSQKKSSMKISADSFDKFDSSGSKDGKKVSSDDLPKANKNVAVKQDVKEKADLLSEGKAIADKKEKTETPKPKTTQSSEDVVQDQQNQLMKQSQLIQQGEETSTEELEAQAADLVKKAQAFTQSQAGQDQPKGDNSPQEVDQAQLDAQGAQEAQSPDSKAQIKQLLGKLQELTKSGAQTQNADATQQPNILAQTSELQALGQQPDATPDSDQIQIQTGADVSQQSPEQQAAALLQQAQALTQAK